MASISKASLVKLGKVVGASVVSGAVVLILSPAVTNLVPAGWSFVITGLVVPALIALDKKVFNSTPVVPTPAPVVPPTPPTPPAPPAA